MPVVADQGEQSGAERGEAPGHLGAALAGLEDRRIAWRSTSIVAVTLTPADEATASPSMETIRSWSRPRPVRGPCRSCARAPRPSSAVPLRSASRRRAGPCRPWRPGRARCRAGRTGRSRCPGSRSAALVEGGEALLARAEEGAHRLERSEQGANWAKAVDRALENMAPGARISGPSTRLSASGAPSVIEHEDLLGLAVAPAVGIAGKAARPQRAPVRDSRCRRSADIHERLRQKDRISMHRLDVSTPAPARPGSAPGRASG